MRVSLVALLRLLAGPPRRARKGMRCRAGWQRHAAIAAKAEAKSQGEPASTTGASERAPVMSLKPGRSCGAAEFEVCLDSTGRINVPGAKRFLPALPGLKPERLSVRRSGVVFGYCV